MGAGLRIPRHSLGHRVAGPQLGLLNQQLLWEGDRGRAPSRAASLPMPSSHTDRLPARPTDPRPQGGIP